MKLTYKAVTQSGKVARGVIEARSVNEAATYLKKQQLIPVKITKSDAGPLGFFTNRQKVKFSELVVFTRQLSTMMQSGLTLMQSLAILKTQLHNAYLIEITGNIITSIEEGSSFSLALSKYPSVFSSIYVSLIKAGESSGLLEKVLARLAENLEKQEKLRSMIRSALVYPVIVIVLISIVIWIMMVFVVPPLAELYKSLNLDLPLPTKMVIALSNLVIYAWPFLIGGFFAVTFGFKKWHDTPGGKYLVDVWLLKTPIFGKLIRQSIMVEFTRTFGLLVGVGGLVVDSLTQCADVVGNAIYKEAVIEVAHRVEKGITIADSMNANPIFPPIVGEMTRIGEQTGKLDETLIKVSEYFEHEVDQTVKTLTVAMEPFIMVLLAVSVGFLIIAIITPIYGLLSAF